MGSFACRKEDSMKKKDVFLIIILLIIAGSTFLGYRYMSQVEAEGEGKVIVTIGGEEYASYPLSLDAKIEIPAELGPSILEIKDGSAKMIQAACPDQICVHHREIYNTNDMIVCLPNKIIIEIDSTDIGEVDSTVQ